MSENKYLKYLPKDTKKDDPRDKREPIVENNSTQNLAPSYDPMGSYTGMEVPSQEIPQNANGEDVIKALQSFGRGTDAFVRGAADTLTLGSIDRVAAALGAATGVGGEFGEYSKNLEAQRAATNADKEQRAPLRIMGQLSGGIAGPAQGLRMFQNATTLPGRMAGGAIGGATAAFPYGYMSSEADLSTLRGQGQALKEGAQAGALGFALGGAMPAVGNAIGRAVDFVRNRVSPDQFSSLPRVTQRNVENLARDMDLPRVQAEARRLGDNAMLADVSPDMRLVAQNAATRPGVTSVVADPLRARDAMRNERLTGALNQSFGPNVDRTVVNDRLGTLRRQAGSEFDRLSATATNDMPAFGTLTKIDEIKASPLGRNPNVSDKLSQIERVLRDQNTGAYGRSAAEFHAARRLADDILNEASTSGSARTAVKAIRDELDAALKQGVDNWPKADARFADIAKRQEAFQNGQTVFNSGREAMRPDEYERYLKGLNRKQKVTEGLGARAELDRIVGQSNNDLAALNRTMMLPGDDPSRKMQLLFGVDPTRRFYNAKEAENIFSATNNAVNSGSQTAQRQGANQLLSAGSETAGAGMPTTVPEMVMAARKRIGDAFRDAAYGRVNEDSARQLARMTVAQGKERDQFIRALVGRANRTDPERDIEMTLKALRPGIVAGLLD
jgi:hypothetical protein